MNLHHGAGSKNGPGVGWVKCECGGEVFKGLLIFAKLHVQEAQCGMQLSILREVPAIGRIPNNSSIYQFTTFRWVHA